MRQLFPGSGLFNLKLSRSSPTKTFKVIYLAQDLTTGVAETLVRDRFQGRARRRLLDVEAAL
jgi:hypothetical protein